MSRTGSNAILVSMAYGSASRSNKRRMRENRAGRSMRYAGLAVNLNIPASRCIQAVLSPWGKSSDLVYDFFDTIHCLGSQEAENTARGLGFPKGQHEGNSS